MVFHKIFITIQVLVKKITWMMNFGNIKIILDKIYLCDVKLNFINT